MKKINVSDITLKTLSENREVSLLFREKTAIAALADTLGADTVELASIKNLREDTIIYKTIAQNTANATVAIPAGFTAEDAENAYNAVKEAKKVRLQVELPVSTVQMEYIYHLKAEKMAEKIASLTKACKAFTEDVEFSALDATRADRDFLITAVKTAVENGATSVCLADTAGIALPDEINELIRTVKDVVNVPVSVTLSDKLGMAPASAIEAVKAGADGFKVAMAGKEVLSMGEISDVIRARGQSLGIETSLTDTRIHKSIDDLLSTLSHESYDEKAVSDKKKLLLDSDTTLSQVVEAAELLGYELSDEDTGNVHRALLQVCEKKGSVGAKEFEALIASFAMQAPSTYHLENYTVNCGSLSTSMSQVTLKKGDEILSGVSTGDGPIDSAFRAIEQCIGYHYELDDFEIQAVTEGKEALGSALVRLRNNGKLYSGNGISTDIIAASIRAYVNALNKIVFEEN